MIPGVALPPGYPDHWGPPPPGVNVWANRLVELDRSSNECKNVVGKFRDRNALAEAKYALGHSLEATYVGTDLMQRPTAYVVEKVVAIRNFSREHSYNGFKQGIMANRGMDEEEVEEIVFHGTNESSALGIADKGFNRDKTQTHRFGLGVYQDMYGPLSQFHALDKGERDGMRIIVSKMASGKVGKTDSDATGPPPGCDCGACDKDRSAWMRISFHDTQICPEYILHIRRT